MVSVPGKCVLTFKLFLIILLEKFKRVNYLPTGFEKKYKESMWRLVDTIVFPITNHNVISIIKRLKYFNDIILILHTILFKSNY